MATEKKNIVVIPSWYPSEEKPLHGTFFREQSRLFVDRYNVLVLYGERRLYGKKAVLKEMLLRKTRKLELLQGPEAFGFIVPVYTFLSEEHNFKRLLQAYSLYFQQLIKEGKGPDLIHAHSLFDAGLIAFLLGKKFNVPVVLTEHNLFLLHNKPKFKIEMAKEALLNFTKLLTVSNDKSRQILMHGLDCEPVVVGNFVDEDIFYPVKQTKEVFTILIVASFSFIKDFKTFFKAIKVLAESTLKPFVVKVVGTGVWGNHKLAMEMADSYGVDRFCEFYPSVSREEMPQVFNEANAFVLTSIAEGLPVSMLEAMSCGIPVFSTACGGVEDVVDEGCGRIVPIRDYFSLGNHLASYINEEIEFYPEVIRNKVINSFGKRVFAKRISDIYDSILKFDKG